MYVNDKGQTAVEHVDDFCEVVETAGAFLTSGYAMSACATIAETYGPYVNTLRTMGARWAM